MSTTTRTTTSTTVQAAGRRTRLDRLVAVNAAFSGATGATLAAGGSWWADQLGGPAPVVVTAVGLGLVGYALLLAWASGRGLTAEAGRAIAALDAAWVAGTAVLLGIAGTSFTGPGLAATVATGGVVGLLGVLQWRAAGRR
ncbi:hypothetical protein [Nocardioides sp. YIM 152588]|uniref:hypothetical protein n=1 Tax=Nocardioides sp. YIM 152588 TaxID=3158259 RepID=UPI0032E4D724